MTAGPARPVAERGGQVVPVDPTARLLQRCRAGDEAAWAELYHQHGGRLARFLRRLLGPGAEADDAVQQVFIAFLTSLPRFDGGVCLSTWLYRIAANVASVRLRSEWRRRRCAAALLEHVGDGSGLALPAPDRRVAAREEVARLAAAVDGLPLKQRLVWMLREVEGLSTDDVAATLRLSPGTVRSRLHHARRRVDAALGREGS